MDILSKINSSLKTAIKELGLSKEDLEEIDEKNLGKIIKKSLKKCLMIKKYFGVPIQIKIEIPSNYQGTKLISGGTYTIKFFPILHGEKVHSKICKKFLLSQPNVIFVGNEGIPLIESLKERGFLKKKYVVSFDTDIRNRISYIYVSHDTSLRYYVSSFNCFWEGDTYIACFLNE